MNIEEIDSIVEEIRSGSRQDAPVIATVPLIDVPESEDDRYVYKTPTQSNESIITSPPQLIIPPRQQVNVDAVPGRLNLDEIPLHPPDILPPLTEESFLYYTSNNSSSITQGSNDYHFDTDTTESHN
jgi:hypothetical protein